MDCKEFNEILLEIDDINVISNEMQKHMKTCETCASEYEETKKLFSDLSPKAELKTPGNFTDNVLSEIENRQKTKLKPAKNHSSIFKKISAIAAIFLLIFSLSYFFTTENNNPFISSASAAENIFYRSIDFLSDIKTIYIKYKVKTLPQDNFEYLDKDCDFVEHTLVKEFTGKKRWKIEKTERAVAFDGKQKYLYIKNVGFTEIGSAENNYIDWMRRLLNPKNIFENELANAKNTKTSKYEITEKDNLIILNVFSKAKGDYTNPYLKNTSFDDADSKTIYTFSKLDTVLQSVKFYIVEENKETLMLDISEIKYNVALSDKDFEIELAEGLKWYKESKTPKDKTFTGITSKKAAEIFFNSISKGDWKSISAFYPDFDAMSDDAKTEIINDYKEIKIIYLKDAFKSGEYPGEFVPYKIQFPDGEVIEHNLAIRNDNENKIWQLDGGF